MRCNAPATTRQCGGQPVERINVAQRGTGPHDLDVAEVAMCVAPVGIEAGRVASIGALVQRAAAGREALRQLRSR
jgi:hypothetical protein